MNSETKSTIFITQRGHAELTGITEVLSFDENSVELAGVDGALSIEGDGIKIIEFDSARSTLIIDGHINGVNYFADSSNEKKRGFFGLFS